MKLLTKIFRFIISPVYIIVSTVLIFIFAFIIVLLLFSGASMVVSENRTLERDAKYKMERILHLTGDIIKTDKSLSKSTKERIEKISDTASEYIYEIQMRSKSDYTLPEDIKRKYLK